MRKQTKIAALVSAAALLAIGASMTSFADWVGPLEDGSYEYHDSYGDAVTDEWRTGKSSRDGQTYYYYLDSDGKMATDQLIDTGDHLYYVNENGERVANYWYKIENTENVTVNDIEPVYLYYYFDKNGQAVSGVNKGPYKTNNDPNNTTTAKFCFDSDYHMVSGWYTPESSTYYCSGEDEGYMLTDWQELTVPESDDSNGEPYDDSKVAWYYFDSNGAMKTDSKRHYLSYDGKKYYFEFKNDGRLIEDGWGKVWTSTASDGITIEESQYYYIDGGYAAQGWVEADYDGTIANNTKDDHGKTYFYFTNGKAYNFDGVDALAHDVAEATGSNATVITRLQKWNEDDGKFEDIATAKAQKYAARVVDGKTYLFNEFGEYLTGVYKIDGTIYRKGSSLPIGPGIYYFDLVSGGPKGSMKTKKETVTNQFDVSRNYQFKSTGEAVASQIVNGVLYDGDGLRVDATDATWMVVEAGKFGYKSDKNTNHPFSPSEKVVVNTNGRVKESGTVQIDGTRYYIKNVPSSKPEGYVSLVGTDYTATSYVIVGYVDVD